MGNRFEGREFFVINSKGSYVDVVPREDKKHYYVPSWSGLILKSGTADFADNPNGIVVERFHQENRLEIQLLPSPAEMPLQEIDTVEQANRMIHEHEHEILSSVHPDTTVLAINHGTNWGFIPENIISLKLREYGYKTARVYPMIDGRKRIQTHGIIINYDSHNKLYSLPKAG